MFFGPIWGAFAGFRVGDQIKTGTRFLGGHRFEPVVFWGRSLVHAAHVGGSGGHGSGRLGLVGHQGLGGQQGAGDGGGVLQSGAGHLGGVNNGPFQLQENKFLMLHGECRARKGQPSTIVCGT